MNKSDALKGPWKAPRIPRGDFGATWAFQGFEEIRRLNCSPETETLVRESGECALETETLVQESGQCRFPRQSANGAGPV